MCKTLGTLGQTNPLFSPTRPDPRTHAEAEGNGPGQPQDLYGPTTDQYEPTLTYTDRKGTLSVIDTCNR